MYRFHFSWVHKPGKFNAGDPLSRNPSFKTLSVVLAVATRRQTQALRPAAGTVTDTVTPTGDTAADVAPAAKCRERDDNTEQDDITTETDADVDADADAADIVSRISEAYAADPMFASFFLFFWVGKLFITSVKHT